LKRIERLSIMLRHVNGDHGMATNDEIRLTIREVRARLRTSVDEAGGQRAWAARYGLSEATVSEVIRGTRSPGPRVLGPLGLRCLEPAYAATAEAGA
jgi:hypothetical protein